MLIPTIFMQCIHGASAVGNYLYQRMQSVRVDNALRLIELLDGELRQSIRGIGRAALLFSGGLDSTVIASLLSKHVDLRLYTAGVANAHDLRSARAVADELSLPLEEVTVREEEVTDSARACRAIFEAHGIRCSFMDLAIYAPMYAALAAIQERTVFSGQGADELFGGYHRYLSMSDEVREVKMRSDLEALLNGGLFRDLSLSAHFSRKIFFPYLSSSIISFALSLGQAEKVMEGERKVVLRRAAAALGLSVAAAPKKAMQYGSGFNPVLERFRVF